MSQIYIQLNDIYLLVFARQFIVSQPVLDLALFRNLLSRTFQLTVQPSTIASNLHLTLHTSLAQRELTGQLYLTGDSKSSLSRISLYYMTTLKKNSELLYFNPNQE